MKNFKDYFKNLKLDKKTVISLIVGFIGISIIFLSEIDYTKKDEIEIDDSNSNDEYCLQLENKIENFIENIDGAGKTKVIITLSETTEYIYAKDGKEVRKNNEKNDDETLENKYVIIENDNINSGLLIKTIEPKIRGVAVSCEGGDNTYVQQQIISAVSALLNINSSKISISKLSSQEDKNEK